MTKRSSLHLIAGSIVAALAIIPVSILFAERPATDEQKRAAMGACMTQFNLCSEHCSGYSSIPQLMNNCNQDCVAKYSQCISTAARRAPDARLPNVRTTATAKSDSSRSSIPEATPRPIPQNTTSIGSRRTTVKDSHDRYADPLPPPTPTPRPIRNNLNATPSVSALPPQGQRQIARDTVRVLPPSSGGGTPAPVRRATTNALSQTKPTATPRNVNKTKTSDKQFKQMSNYLRQ